MKYTDADKEKINILLVDDREEGIITLESILNKPDYNLIKASSGMEALSLVLKYDFALILLDVQMPDIDGFETARIIKQRARSQHIPIIFITAISKTEDYVSSGYSVGAVDYVFKPFDPHILKSKVAVFVDLHRKNLLIQKQAEILRDVDRRERLRTLTELEHEGHRRYQNLADAIPQIVFRADKVGAIDYFNQFWRHYTLSSPLEVKGTGWHAYVDEESIPRIEQHWREALKTRSGFECECRVKNGNTGEYRWHLLRVVPEFNDMTDLVCWIGTAADIHDQRLSHERLLQAKEDAEHANETKSRFLANMSHEIRTPLGIILGFSELLASSETTGSDKNDALAAIRRNGQLLSKVIDDILDLSKVEANKLEVELGEISTLDLINHVRTIMSLPAREKALDLRFAIQGKIPTRIVSNAPRIQQILVNIIGNAIKFTPRGKVEITISHLPESQGTPSRLQISVKDSGPGLSKEQIAQLFQPFAQGDASITRKFGGTGLGLVLSQKMARLLGGDVKVGQSAPGEGCTFDITFKTGPIGGVEMTSSFMPKKSLSVVSAIKSEEALNGVKVLLVEDSKDNQFLVSRFLTSEGASVNFANNGIEGVKMAMEGNYDVVLMDIQMPELDGYGAITQLRGRGFKKPIIALTAHGMVEDRKRCIEVGSDAHITKPINRSDLVNRIFQLSSRLSS